MDSIRQQKVNSLILRELAEIFRQETPSLLPGGMITVTAVRVSPDLGLARTYVSLFPVKDKLAALERIRGHGPHVRGLLGRSIGHQMRVVPELSFHLDDSLDRAEEIDELLKKG